MTLQKIGLAGLAKAMGVERKIKEITPVQWERKSITLCAKCGAKLTRSKTSASVRICMGDNCNYTKQIRYGERQAGEYIASEKQFRQRIVASRDYFKRLSAFGLVPEIVDKLKKLGCKTILLRDRENFCKYSVDYDIFTAHSFGYRLHNGVTLQYLNDKYWVKTDLPRPKKHHYKAKVSIKTDGKKKN